MKMYIKSAIAAFGLALAAQGAHAELGETLKTVKERGTLNCTGHNGSYLGFAEVDDQGNWKGLDVDMCRAVATAIFGSPDKLNIVPISWAQRWPSLQSGDVDVVIKASGGTFSRDT
ncbi:MAG: transporter substrate-binding domain-containing protein, partial [Roseovarius indicus]